MEYEIFQENNNDDESFDDYDSLNLSYSALSPEEVVEFLKEDLSLDKSIKYLNLSRIGLDDENIVSITHLLKDCSNITHLDLSWNAFGEKGAKAIMDMLLCRKSAIKSLNIEVTIAYIILILLFLYKLF